ncbi:hypothetical protein [Streptomyces ambofaciens]|uniref:hypothetical protein n=1 Tax=Streptomyces ambofaciens TaxID=1889 RepID=UPI00099E6D10|nr:hypothetical protein [Streptomyces ambofaciens]
MPLHAGKHRAAGPRRRGPDRGRPDRGRVRVYGLVAFVAGAVVLPFAVASAGPPGGTAEGPGDPPTVRLLPRGGDGKVPGGADRVPSQAGPVRSALPPGPATALRCGPALTSPEGVEAQTCVLTQGAETWARTYYRNATGGPLESVLSLMGPEGRSVRMRCAVGAEDEPGTCETPREPLRGGPAQYTAVAEFAGRAGYGPLLLRTGSNGSHRADGGHRAEGAWGGGRDGGDGGD